MNRKPKRAFDPLDGLPTAADYLAAGVAPFLIMAMVGALVWFVQDLVYQGEHALRLRWTLFWFVIGMVGVGRIAIEKTQAYAGLYALALGAAVGVMVNRYFPMPLTGWLLLALIWWCTNKLVWDCTLVDDKEDASGEGLLEVAGMDETAAGETRDDVAVQTIQTRGRSKQKPVPWWQRLFVNQPERAGQPHAHGLWIVFFALAALPVFGFGQRLLAGAGRESPGLALLAVYLAAAIGLLLLTSFLGLRRYLRQRRLKMPVRIAGTWIGVGTLITVAVLVLSFALPKPLTLAPADSPGKQLPGRTIEDDFVKDDPDSRTESEQARSGGEQTPANETSREGGTTGAEKETTQTGAQEPGRDSNEQGRNGGGAAGPMTLPEAPAWLHWLVWGAFAVALLWLAVRNRHELLTALRDLLASLRDLFRPRQSERRRTKSSQPVMAKAEAGPRFADLPNPFRAGGSVEPETAVRQTYEAVEVWAAEHGLPRSPDLTSTEFATQLMDGFPELRAGLHRLARLYAGLVYAERRPTAEELPPLEALWQTLENRSVPGTPTG